MAKRAVDNRNYTGPDRRLPENRDNRRKYVLQSTDTIVSNSCCDEAERALKLKVLEQRFDSFEEKYANIPETIAGLSGRLQLLIWIISLMSMTALTGVIYSFNAVNTFKDQYIADNEKREESNLRFSQDIRKNIYHLQDEMHTTTATIRSEIIKQVSNLEKSQDTRFDTIEKGFIGLESQLRDQKSPDKK